jgi:hypothetical protein
MWDARELTHTHQYTYSVARRRGHTRDIIKIIGIVCNYTAILFYGINIYMRSSSKRVTQKYTVGNTALLRQHTHTDTGTAKTQQFRSFTTLLIIFVLSQFRAEHKLTTFARLHFSN